MFPFNLIVLYYALKLFLCVKHSFAHRAIMLPLQRILFGACLLFGAKAVLVRSPPSVKKRHALSSALGVFRCLSASGNDLQHNEALVATAEKGGRLRMIKSQKEESGWIRVYCRYIVRNGKVIYPKHGSCISFLVRA